MSFQLVSKSVTLNDLERRNSPYFALFYRIWLFQGRIATMSSGRRAVPLQTYRHSTGNRKLSIVTALSTTSTQCV